MGTEPTMKWCMDEFCDEYYDGELLPDGSHYCAEHRAERISKLRGLETQVKSTTGGVKGQKEARYDLIPGEALEMLARNYGRGARKYDERNWERGYDWSLSFAALNRHLWQFWNGEDMDEEVGLPHLTCVLFHAMALLQFQLHPEKYAEFDNRPSTQREE